MGKNHIDRRVGALLVAALTLAGCSSAPTGSSVAPTPTQQASGPATAHNQADVRFAQMVLTHQQVVLEAARIARVSEPGPAVREFAADIERSRLSTTGTMTGWLREWGATPLGSDGVRPGLGYRGAGQASEAIEPSPALLEQATGDAFDRLFLELVTLHDQRLVPVAEAEIISGIDPTAVAAAHTTIVDQAAERELITRLSAEG